MSKNMLLFKVLSDSDDGKEDGYVKAISQNFDLNVTPVSVLKFVFQNEDLLLEQLRDPGVFDGLILTSPRSVEAVLTAFKALSEDDTDLKTWRNDKICYVVGDASFEKVKNGLKWSEDFIRGQETGNAKNLSAKIVDDFGGKKAKFLFPCGNLKRDILPETLARAGIELEVVECYITEQAHELESSIESFRDEFESLDLAAFFSPSGVKFSWPIMSSLFPQFESSCRFLSIGPVTTQVLEARGCRKIFTASHPNVDGLVEAIKAALESVDG